MHYSNCKPATRKISLPEAISRVISLQSHSRFILPIFYQEEDQLPQILQTEYQRIDNSDHTCLYFQISTYFEDYNLCCRL